MKKMMKKFPLFLMLAIVLAATIIPVYAAGESVGAADAAITAAAATTGSKAIAAAIAIGLAAAAGAIGMGIAIAKAVEAISRQPEAEGKIRTGLMLGLVFIETAIIYALIIAILIIFVL